MSNLKNTLEDGLSMAQSGLDSGKKKLEINKEMRQLENEIRQLNNRKAENFLNIGQYIHLLYRKRGIDAPDLRDIFYDISVIDTTIWNHRERIKDLKAASGSLTCKQCNIKIHINEKFCANCGASTDDTQQSEFMLACTVCEQLLSESYNFCPVCGNEC